MNVPILQILRNSLICGMRGNAKSIIEGLSRSRYDRPHLIHQAHVEKIVETPNLKEGNFVDFMTYSTRASAGS